MTLACPLCWASIFVSSDINVAVGNREAVQQLAIPEVGAAHSTRPNQTPNSTIVTIIYRILGVQYVVS